MSDSILILSGDGAPFNFYDPAAMPNREHMEEPFELLQISIQPYGKDLNLMFLQTGIRPVKYTAFPGSAYRGARQQTEMPFLHTHDYYELLFVLEGEIYQNIDNFRHFYSAGSACFVTPFTLHSEEYTAGTDARLLFLKLHRDYAAWLLGMPRYFDTEETTALKRCRAYFESGEPYMDFIPRADARVRERIHPLFEQLFTLFTGPDTASSPETAALICRLLEDLFDSALFGNTPVAPGSRTEQQRFHDIRRFMEQQPGRVTRAQLEETFHYSGDYLYKLVRRYTGLSIQDFALQISMKKAAQLLISSDLRINEIAEQVGFHNFTQFYRAFRGAYGETPRRYRINAQDPSAALSEHAQMRYNEG